MVAVGGDTSSLHASDPHETSWTSSVFFFFLNSRARRRLGVMKNSDARVFSEWRNLHVLGVGVIVPHIRGD